MIILPYDDDVNTKTRFAAWSRGGGDQLQVEPSARGRIMLVINPSRGSSQSMLLDPDQVHELALWLLRRDAQS